MKAIKYNKLDFTIYEEVLENGLHIYLCKIPRHTVHARMTTFFGGSILEFKQEGEKEFTKMPAGVAHFLEHKLFEKEDYNPMQIYENNGAMSNAFTNKFITSYYFSCVNKFYDNLTNLIKLVHNPYFTDENVLKEKGIISQEKKEDLDNPYSVVHEQNQLNTFHNLDYKNSVLGSLEDINNITKEDLYKCFETFYHPSNMMLTICGDIDIKETINFIKESYKNIKFNKQKKIEIKKKKEPLNVVLGKQIIYKDIHKKIINISYKIKKTNENNFLNKIYLSLLLDMKFGSFSKTLDIVNNDNNYLSKINCILEDVEDFYVLTFSVSVKDNVDDAINLIEKQIKDLNFDEKEFNLIKKVILSSLILSTENSYDVCSMIVNQIRMYGGLKTEMYDLYANLDFKDFKQFIKSLNFDNKSIVILKQKEDN